MFPSDEALDKLNLSLLHQTVLGLNKLDLTTLLASITRPALDAGDAQGRTALYWAAVRGDDATVAMLIEHGACLNKGNYEGMRPLDVAAASGNEASVWRFLESGLDTDLNYVSSGGWTPLLHFCISGTSVEMVERLLSRGADLESRSWNGESALIMATSELRDDLVRCLIARGANVNSVDHDNRSSLHIAIWYHSSAALQLLLQHNADYTIKTHAGETVLHYAAHHGDLETLETLRLFDLRAIDVQDRVTNFSSYQKAKGLVGLTAPQIAEQRRDVAPEWMDAFHRLVQDIEFPETTPRVHSPDDVSEVFEDALEYQGGAPSGQGVGMMGNTGVK